MNETEGKNANTIAIVENSLADQKASNNAVPSTTANHQHPDMQPAAGHCMKGGKYN